MTEATRLQQCSTAVVERPRPASSRRAAGTRAGERERETPQGLPRPAPPQPAGKFNLVNSSRRGQSRGGASQGCCSLPSARGASSNSPAGLGLVPRISVSPSRARNAARRRHAHPAMRTPPARLISPQRHGFILKLPSSTILETFHGWIAMIHPSFVLY